MMSSRTLSTSYFATGANALTPGCHTVQTVGKAVGTYRHLMMNSDMPLLWLD